MTLEELKNHLLDDGKVYRRVWRDENGKQKPTSPVYAEIVAGSLVAYYPNGEKIGQLFSMVIANDWEIYTGEKEVSEDLEPCYAVIIFDDYSFVITDRKKISNSDYYSLTQGDPNIIKIWDDITKMELLEVFNRLPAQKQILNRRPKPEDIKAQKNQSGIPPLWDIVKTVLSSDFMCKPNTESMKNLEDKLVKFVQAETAKTSISNLIKYDGATVDNHGNVTVRFAVYESSESDEIKHYIDYDLATGKTRIVNKEEV